MYTTTVVKIIVVPTLGSTFSQRPFIAKDLISRNLYESLAELLACKSFISVVLRMIEIKSSLERIRNDRAKKALAVYQQDIRSHARLYEENQKDTTPERINPISIWKSKANLLFRVGC